MPENKDIKLFVRSVTQEQIRETEKGSRKFTFVASDSTRDSAGTVLNQGNWDLERFNANGIIGYQHKVYHAWDDTANPDNVIGKGHAYVKDNKLMVDVELEPAEINPLAEKIYQKLLFGSLKAVSVGFIPIGHGQWGKGDEAIGEKNETYYYAGQQLLEISIVNIPANPNALKKGVGFVDEELELLRSQAREEESPVQVPPEEAPQEEQSEEQQRAAVNAARISQVITEARAVLLD